MGNQNSFSVRIIYCCSEFHSSLLYLNRCLSHFLFPWLSGCLNSYSSLLLHPKKTLNLMTDFMIPQNFKLFSLYLLRFWRYRMFLELKTQTSRVMNVTVASSSIKGANAPDWNVAIRDRWSSYFQTRATTHTMSHSCK